MFLVQRLLGTADDTRNVRDIAKSYRLWRKRLPLTQHHGGASVATHGSF
ncbi:MAG: hypothetical protein RL518_274 [Pseudomonadota bacterium]